MRKAVVISLLALFAAPGLCAQAEDPGRVTVNPQPCVWRAGDNPAWGRIESRESAWHPYAQWKPQPAG